MAFVVRVRARLLIFSLPSPLNPHHLAGWQYKERSFRKTLFNPLDKHINATTRASPPLVATITCPEKSDTRSASNAVGPCAVVLSVSTTGFFPRGSPHRSQTTPIACRRETLFFLARTDIHEHHLSLCFSLHTCFIHQHNLTFRALTHTKAHTHLGRQEEDKKRRKG